MIETVLSVQTGAMIRFQNTLSPTNATFNKENIWFLLYHFVFILRLNASGASSEAFSALEAI